MQEPPKSIALACAAAAIVLCGVVVADCVTSRGWKITTFVRMSASEPMAGPARQTDHSFAFVAPIAHYDGVYFYAMARDPFARGLEHTLIDRAAYRYGHVGYAWLARIVSLGNDSLIPLALLLVGLAGVGVAGFAASLLAHELGWSGWWGLIIAVSPGLIFAITADTSEPVALAFAFLGLLLWSRRRWWLAGIFLAAACMTKEPMLVLPVGLAIWELVQRSRRHTVEAFKVRLAVLAIGPLIFLGWYVYLRATFGVWPLRQEAQDFLTLPFFGWLQSIRQAAFNTMGRGTQLGSIAIALIASIGAVLVIGLIRSARVRTLLDPVFILAVIVVAALNPLGVLFPKDLIRESAFATALLPFAILGRGSMATTSSEQPMPHAAIRPPGDL